MLAGISPVLLGKVVMIKAWLPTLMGALKGTDASLDDGFIHFQTVRGNDTI
jgi:hypothetical protein